eukprot:18443-Amorphochlora_amoeboformis.AAC.1
MEHEILESLATLHNTKVVVRSGSPILATDLNKVAASSARAIIVMSQENLGPCTPLNKDITTDHALSFFFVTRKTQRVI